jgi:hypothetical protein
MKVFISWSGERSKTIATFLRKWIPDVIQAAEPWMSGEDIDAGARWNNQVQKELEESKFGIICLTSESLDSTWIHFEAGALAKTVQDSFVCPYLIGLKPEDVPEGPLSQFQRNSATKEGTWKIIFSMNEAMKDAHLPKEQLERQFGRCWPELEKTLQDLPLTDSSQKIVRKPEEMIPEILEIVRGLSRQLSQLGLDFGWSPLYERLLRLSEERRSAPLAAIFPDIEPGESIADYARRTRGGWMTDPGKIGWADYKPTGGGAEENKE